MEHIKNIYSNIQNNLQKNIDTSLSEKYISGINECHTFGNDYNIWTEAFSDYYEHEIYQNALDEYHCAILFLANGLYRQSYASIRFCLEQTLFGLYLSVNEMQYIMWKNSKRDVHWNEIIDLDKGIFSKNFIESYSPEFLDISGELRQIASELYRELSEYIHGNPKATQSLPSDVYSFSESCYGDIINKVRNVRYVVNLMFFIRYKNKLTFANPLEQMIMDNIGENPQVQAFVNTNREVS